MYWYILVLVVLNHLFWYFSSTFHVHFPISCLDRVRKRGEKNEKKRKRSVQIHSHLHISKYSLVPTSSKLLFWPPTDSHREATNHIMYILTSASLLFADFYSSFVIVRQKKMKKNKIKNNEKKPNLFSELLYSLSDIQYIYLLSLSLSVVIFSFGNRNWLITTMFSLFRRESNSR